MCVKMGIAMTVKDALLEKLDHLPLSQQKELLRFAQLLESKVKAEHRPATEAKSARPRKSRVTVDPETGFPVLDVGPDAPVLTNEMVREMLADFP